MKIQTVTSENHSKALGLLRRAFPGSNAEVRLVETLHANGKPMHEWVALHTNKVIAYIGFSCAFNGAAVCGLHLAPLAVSPEFQKQGIGSELLRFALRQEEIRTKTIFVLGAPGFYKKFGFEPCAQPICPFDENNAHFLALRNSSTDPFTVGYEPEFSLAGPEQPPARQSGRARRKR